jgi:hypothetical protein
MKNKGWVCNVGRIFREYPELKEVTFSKESTKYICKKHKKLFSIKEKSK